MTLLDSLSFVARGSTRLGSWPHINQSGLALLGAAVSTVFYFTGPAQAAEQAVLQYADRQITVSLTELKTFAENGTASPELATFIQQIPPTAEFERELLTDDLPVLFTPSGSQTLSRNSEFVLYQINKLIGEPNSTPNYDNLQTALVNSTKDQNSFTVLAVMAAYPTPTVHVDLAELDRVYGDVRLFLERLQPLFQSKQLINDWLCECAAPRADGRLHPSESCGRGTPVQPSASVSMSTSSSTVAPTSTAANKRLVITFGPLGRSFSIAELAELAETGIPSRRLNYYLKLAKVEPADFQAALNKEVKINFRLLDRVLSTIVGEYVLFRMSDIIHTQNRAGDIPALRSALVLSAQDSQITPIEVMQRYPTQEIYLDGLALLKASNTVRRVVKQDFGQVTSQIADWLETIQVSIATDVCKCEASGNAESPPQPQP